MSKIINDFDSYSLEKYKNDIDKNGMENVWNEILENTFNNTTNDIFQVKNFGELYEIGLAHMDKMNKKELGKYYTPEDVANVMSNWLKDIEGNNICDVCCGTGNLILSYLKNIGNDEVKELLKNKSIYLYDIDSLALKICKYSIAIIYGKEYLNNINTICCDFLSKDIKLPDKSKVISNPPYFKITEIKDGWDDEIVIKDSKEFYSAIMNKILKQSISSVIITPYSFISGNKFYSLRKEMNNHTGFIVSFDNVPGNIFNGRKHGIFNTNNANSVRAAITVTENKKDIKGYRISPLIRFKSEEREKILSNEVLDEIIPENLQLVDDKNKNYYKCFPTLSLLYSEWILKSNKKLKNIISKESKYVLCVPNSCRYFTVASKKNLSRTGKYLINFDTEENMHLAYCFINSSFCYWYWRLFDGGVNYSLNLILDMPIFFDKLSEKDKESLIEIAKEMQNKEKDYLSYKKNANKMQENIKFPESYRKKINKIFINNLTKQNIDLEIIHNNYFFK